MSQELCNTCDNNATWQKMWASCATCYLRLPELIKQRFGVLELYWWLATKNTFWHETYLGKSSRADICRTRLQTTLCIFFESTGVLCLRIFGDRTKPLVLLIQNKLCNDKFEWWTAFESKNCYYKYLLVYSHVKTGAEPHAEFNE